MINFYLAGGKTPDQQFVQELIESLVFGEDPEQAMQMILQIAKEQPKILQQLFQIWLKDGIDGVVTAIQLALLTQRAEKGAKLNRLMALSNRCPEGYMKKGGKCKKCEKGENFTNPNQGALHTTKYFEDGGLNTKKSNPQLANNEREILRKNKSREIDRNRRHMEQTPGPTGGVLSVFGYPITDQLELTKIPTDTANLNNYYTYPEVIIGKLKPIIKPVIKRFSPILQH